jgi:DNA-binding NtrC family response regulator
LPPLRDRPRELAVLAQNFVDQARTRAQRGPVSISAGAMRALSQHSWPGNVRELKNTMEYVAATVADSVVEAWHLPPEIVGGSDEVSASVELPPPPRSATFRALADEVRDLERTRMQQALDTTEGVQTRAAQLLGMPIRTFTAKMKQFGITRTR